MPTSTDSAWKIWQDKLQDLDEKLSARYSQQISLLRDRVDHLEKQVFVYYFFAQCPLTGWS